jgi:hypothetical protein
MSTNMRVVLLLLQVAAIAVGIWLGVVIFNAGS